MFTMIRIVLVGGWCVEGSAKRYNSSWALQLSHAILISTILLMCVGMRIHMYYNFFASNHVKCQLCLLCICTLLQLFNLQVHCCYWSDSRIGHTPQRTFISVFLYVYLLHACCTIVTAIQHTTQTAIIIWILDCVILLHFTLILCIMATPTYIYTYILWEVCEHGLCVSE